MQCFRYIFLMVMLSAASCCTARAADVIEWRLENPFRFFNRAEDTQKHLDAFKAIYKKDGNTKTPILEIERQLSRDTDGRGWAEAMYTRVHQEPCWITSKDKCEHPDYVLPKTHAVKFRLPAQSGTCIWSVDKGPGASIPVSARTKSCDEWTPLPIPYEGNIKTGGATVTVTVGGNVVATEFIHVDDILVAGLGDSFASGEGNPDKPAVYHKYKQNEDQALAFLGKEMARYPRPITNASWLDEKCHRSLYSHQMRVALHLAISDPATGGPATSPQRSVTYIGLSCTGAEIVEGLFQGLHDHRGQLSALVSALCKRRPDEPGKGQMKKIYKLQTLKGVLEDEIYSCPAGDRLRDLDVLLLSIGGNDVEFSRIIEGAAFHVNVRNKLDGLSEIIEEFTGNESQFKPRYPDDKTFGKRIELLGPNYAQLADAISSAGAITKNASRVFLTAYPYIAYAGPNEICPTTTVGMSVSPVYRIDQVRALAAECAIQGGACVDEIPPPKINSLALSEIQAAAAKNHDWIFSKSFRSSDEFKTHGICAYSSDELKQSSALGNNTFPRGEKNVFHPGSYRHYAQRTRWFRSPNDAYLGARSKNWTAKLELFWEEKFALWVAYFGAFHPTGEGQAYMADMVFKDVAAWLNRAK